MAQSFLISQTLQVEQSRAISRAFACGAAATIPTLDGAMDTQLRELFREDIEKARARRAHRDKLFVTQRSEIKRLLIEAKQKEPNGAAFDGALRFDYSDKIICKEEHPEAKKPYTIDHTQEVILDVLSEALGVTVQHITYYPHGVDGARVVLYPYMFRA